MQREATVVGECERLRGGAETDSGPREAERCWAERDTRRCDACAAERQGLRAELIGDGDSRSARADGCWHKGHGDRAAGVRVERRTAGVCGGEVAGADRSSDECECDVTRVGECHLL